MFSNAMVRIRLLAVLIFCHWSGPGYSQQDISVSTETWWGLMTSAQVSNRFSLWNDSHYSHELFFIYRTGLTYHPKKDNFVTTAGYAYLKLTAPFSEGKLVRPEHRPWMQTIYRVPSTKKLSTDFRFMYELRFMQDLGTDDLLESFSYNHRWRFFNALRYAWGNVVSRNTLFTTAMFNEAFFTTGPGPNGARHEHRTHLAAQITKNGVTGTVACMVRYINLSPETARVTVGPVFWLSFNLNLLKKAPPTFIEYPADHPSF